MYDQLDKFDEMMLARRGYLYRTDDLGMTTFNKLDRFTDAMCALVNGLKYGYPICCILEFCFDSIDGRLSALRRGGVPNGNDSGVYVPCSKCCEEIGREYFAS